VVALLDALEIKRAVLCGHSMGGAISQLCALEHPTRVAGLVLVGTGAKLRVAPAILEGILQDFSKTVALVAHWAYGPSVLQELKELSAQVMAELDPAVIHGDFLACDRFDIRQRLAEIQAPALVIGATADRMTPLKFSEYLAEKLLHATLEVIQDAGHMMALEKPELVGAAVGRFMAQFGV
jgi:pimeloyl-ACP methyl ester carboxylesterase